MPDARPILAIETSNPSAWTPQTPVRPGVAVGRLDAGRWEVLAVEAVDPTRRHDDDLMPAVARACARARIRASGLGGVAVSVGPGGYTAVRLAVTVARMIAEAGGSACLPVPTAAAVALRRQKPDEPAAIALASKGETAFVTVVGVGGPPEPGLVDAAGLEALHGLGVRRLVVDQFVPGAIRSRAESLGWAIERPVFDPVACLEASVGVEAVDPLNLAPIYPREPEAVTKWRALHGGGDR